MIRKNIPNFITCLNIVSGSLSVIYASYGQLTLAAIFIFTAALLDFIDGLTARLLNAYSPIGKDLDSLADMISFGFAPGMVMFVLLKSNLSAEQSLSSVNRLLPFLSLLIPVFSALRLAVFNNDTRQISSFIGLPTPANAIFICSLALIHSYGRYQTFDSQLLSIPSLIVITIFFSLLLVSPFPMFSLKFKNLKWKFNQIRIIFLILSVLLISMFVFYGIAAIIIIYILLSLFKKKMNESEPVSN